MIVSCAVAGWVPVMAVGWVMEHVGASTAPDGPPFTAHESCTVPVNPPLGVTVTTEVPFTPGDAMLIGAPLNANRGVTVGPVTVAATFTVAVVVPDVPVTVVVKEPAVVVGFVLTVSVAVTG